MKKIYYIDFLETENNFFNVIYYRLEKHNNKIRLSKLERAFFSPFKADFLKYNFDVSIERIIKIKEFSTEEKAKKYIIKKHEYLKNKYFIKNDLSKFTNLNYIFSYEYMKDKAATHIFKLLSYGVKYINYDFSQYQLNIMKEINKQLKDIYKYKICIKTEETENGQIKSTYTII